MSTRTSLDGSCLAEVQEMTGGWVPGWAASFGMANQVGLGSGQTFVNPLHLRHESGSEVLFAPLCPARTALSNVGDDLWASSRPAAALQAVPSSI